jgi:phage terminase Nu1 subunit (DNA packaging protein)
LPPNVWKFLGLSVVVVVFSLEARPLSVLINKRGLARMLGVSIPTVSEMLDRYPDFPVEVRGRVGLKWQFNAADVQAFLAGKRAEEAATAGATRVAFLAQASSRLEKAGPGAATSGSAQERLAHARALVAEDKLARERSQLVRVDDLRTKLGPVFAKIGEWMQTLPADCAAHYNLSDAVVGDMRARISAEHRELYAQLKDWLPADAALPPDGKASAT